MYRFVVEDRAPVQTSVYRLPDSTGGRTRVVHEFVAGYAHRTRHPVSNRADVAEISVVQHLLFEGLC